MKFSPSIYNEISNVYFKHPDINMIGTFFYLWVNLNISL